MTNPRAVWRRRGMLAGGALAVFAWVRGAPHLLSLGGSDFEFEEIADLPPFRRLGGTRPITTGAIALAGIDAPEPETPEDKRAKQLVRNDPCRALFGTPRDGSVPVAMFSDFSCPICKTMNMRLGELQEQAPNSFHIVRHQLPLFGLASETASRAVLAADRQGGYVEMHDRLNRTPAITDKAFVARVAAAIGLDETRLLRDMSAIEVGHQLRVSRALADVFGFYGTPAFVVGRTVFLGAMSKSSLKDLIALEAESRFCET